MRVKSEKRTRKKMMSMNVAALIIIVASFLEPLYSANSSPQLPTFAVPDNNDESTFYEKSCTDKDDRTNFILTLYVPDRTEPQENSTFYLKRQFDPWGGKRQPKGFNLLSTINQKLTKRKRQFSPWGGKRSVDRAEQNNDDVVNDEELSYILSKKRNVKYLKNKRNFQLRGGKRNFQPWGGKRNFQPWGGKRNFHPWGGKRNFQPWGGKRNFQPWGGKRNFRPWGGKRISILKK
ncbi:uncharacterized protein LOC118194245 isoform X2 [Stegodyphus dumicola]|uniref:uncharacterized protein LOC118194245 isoform X2 n=1 Tax=Stegodyphus dumicola TaxID=202533 RepID=UPI0015B08C4D|nr:uncharacterized protein LOC118194245 isoform X2 [Stegodyphus dumicola]